MITHRIKITSNTKVIFIFLFMLTISSSFAQYSITKHVISNGGGTSVGNTYQVSGTMGQADASNPMTGGGFAITGGFWANSINPDIIFKNDFE